MVRSARRHPGVKREVVKKGFGAHLPDDFLFAGSSALLIAVAHLGGGSWFVALFALTPLLWRSVRAGLAEAMLTGGLVAAILWIITLPGPPLMLTLPLLVRFAGLVLLFVSFAAAVNTASRFIGFNAIIIALLWLPLEYALGVRFDAASIFPLDGFAPAAVVKISSLFGALLVSFTIVLVNSLILIILCNVVRFLNMAVSARPEGDERDYVATEERRMEGAWPYLGAPRSPPRRPARESSAASGINQCCFA
jgi:hypothetical protein